MVAQEFDHRIWVGPAVIAQRPANRFANEKFPLIGKKQTISEQLFGISFLFMSDLREQRAAPNPHIFVGDPLFEIGFSAARSLSSTGPDKCVAISSTRSQHAP